MKNCETYIELMSAVLDGECTAGERRELEEHLASCPECAALYEQLRRSTRAARELDCEVPADLKARIMNNLPAQESAKQGRVIRWKRWVPVAAAACLALVIALVPAANHNDNVMSLRSDSAEPSPAASSAPQDKPMGGYEVSASSDGAPAAGDDASDPGSAGQPYGQSVPSAAPSVQPTAEPRVDAPAEPTMEAPSAEPEANFGVEGNPGKNDGSGADTNANTNEDNMGSHLDLETAPVPPGIQIEPPSGGVIGGGDVYTGEPDQYYFSNSQAIRVAYGSTPAPGALVIGSVEELNAYLALFGSNQFDVNGDPVPVAALQQLTGQYTEEFFVTGRLVCAVVEAGSGSNRYEITGLYRDRLTVLETVPDVGTCDMAAWLLIAETDTMFDGGNQLEVVIIH